MRLALVLALVGTTRAAAADDLPTIDSAIPPTIRVTASDNAIVRRVAIDVRGAPEVTWLRVDASGRMRSYAATIAIDLPRGARVLGVATTIDEDVHWALPTKDAVGDDAVADDNIAAVLQPAGMTGDEEHLRLRVAPRNRTVELALALPAEDVLAIDPGASRAVAITLAGAPVAAKPGRTTRLDVHALAGAAPSAPQVAYAIEGPGPSVITDVFETATAIECSFGARDIRRIIRRYQAQLRQCYMQVAQRTPHLSGTATLHVRIAPEGTVRWAKADGDLPGEVTTCLAGVAEDFEFPQSSVESGDTEFNYPLTFRIAGDQGAPGSGPSASK